MKRRLAWLTALTLLFACFQFAASAQDISSWKGPQAGYTVARWTASLSGNTAAVRTADPDGAPARLYSAPDTGSDVLFVYFDGVRLNAEKAPEAGWYKVKADTLEGYMQEADLVTDSASSVTSKMPLMYPNPGNASSAPMRKAPDKSAAAVAWYPAAVPVTVLGYNDAWAHLLVNGKYGFMATEYLWSDAHKTYVSPIAQDITPARGRTTVAGDSVRTPSHYTGGDYGTGEWTVSDARYNAAVYNPNPNTTLNLRDEPSASSASLGHYYNGTRVILHSVSADGWAFVSIGTLSGYMDASYLVMIEENSIPRSVMPLLYLDNRASSTTYLLEYRSMAARAVGLYYNGDEVTVMGYNDTWAHVIMEGQIGFLPVSVIKNFVGKEVVPPAQSFSWSGPVGYHPTAAWPFGGTGWVVSNPNPADRLNLRTQPRKESGSRGKYYNGVNVIVDSIADGWAHVTIGSLSGYMDMTFLSSGVASAMPILKTTSSVNLRAAMSTTSTSLDKLPAGTQVIVMGFTAQWAHVIVGGQMGFIYAKYLK